MKENILYYTNSEIQRKFNITRGEFDRIIKYCDIKQIPNNERKLNLLLKNVSKESIEKCYIQENHDFKDCIKILNITQGEFFRLLKAYGIHKDNEKHTTLIKATKLERYGDENFNNQAQRAKTNVEIYGVDNQFKRKEMIKESWQETLGVDHPMQKREIKEKAIENRDAQAAYEHGCETYFKKTGYHHPWSNPEVRNKIKQDKIAAGKPIINVEAISKTCMEKYHVPYPCMRPECRKASSSNSKPNREFKQLLIDNGFTITKENTEFPIENRSYDFKVDNKLIEINPSATHNVTWPAFGKRLMDKNYHKMKSQLAEKHGYRCIHIFDWEDKQKIIDAIKPKELVKLENCEVREVTYTEAVDFINKHHFQNYAVCKIRIGLYYNNELILIMTFRAPRYNKHYEWELVRYCGDCKHKVIGGAEKIFDYFKDKYHPTSVISYCDLSKFSIDTYEKLGIGLTKLSVSSPSCHWYNLKTKQHITNNLLIRRGFDQLFGTHFGNKASNPGLMRAAGFVEVYDCGQATYVYGKAK